MRREEPPAEMLCRNRLARAQRGDEDAFAQLTAPYRRELQLHCYRILGSLQDAEDLLQETLLGAWRGLEQFEGRSSLRAWLYTIATNRCLNALRDRRRRPAIVHEASENHSEVPWLEPYPDRLLEGLIDAAPGPAARYEAKETVALAFISGLQHLAPRQRAVLVLRDVLGFHGDEVAEMLGTSVASVNSALQRARAVLEARVPAGRERLSVAAAPDDLVVRFAEAFERDDIDAVVSMLTEDAIISMPPEPEWHQGREAIAAVLRRRRAIRGSQWFFVRGAGANLQPAYAYYLPVDGVWTRSGMFVLSVGEGGITSVTRFPEAGGVVGRFGVPATLR